jgi:hypothetical protein
VNYFCYPAGRYNASVIATVRSAGYSGATTTDYGVAHPRQGRFTLDRIRVDGTDTAIVLHSAESGLTRRHAVMIPTDCDAETRSDDALRGPD